MMLKRMAAFLSGLCLLAGVACGQAAIEDASATIGSPQISDTAKGRRVVQDVILATSAASYTLRYDVIERADDPARVDFSKWAPTIGYTPLGIAGPSMENWYNQGFFIWTFDDFNINDWKATFRVVREFGADAMVEYVWDTPKVKAVARFAITSQSDKLLFFGRYEPKEPIRDVKLRFMAYPVTFEKPWTRALTTHARTLTEGSAAIDLDSERWLLLEDIQPDRPGAGSAGLILGDATASSSVTVSAIGGYAEYVDIALNPEQRAFALGLYEFPGLPDYEETRAYFRRIADAESDAIAKLTQADLDQPLVPLPTDAERIAHVVRADEEQLERPAETWQPNPAALDFPWAAQVSGPPVGVALFVARWAAYDTMELAWRVEMNVRHQYFDTADTLADPNAWPYRGQTGIGALGTSLAARNAARICLDDATDVIVVASLNPGAIGPRLRAAIIGQVQSGKGLLIAGGANALAGWPAELSATPDASLVQPALDAIPWAETPGLRAGSRGRAVDGPPLEGYRYGEGRVVVFKANTGRYQSILPLNDVTEGLEGADDRILALHAMALLAAAGRPFPCSVTYGKPAAPVEAGQPATVPVTIAGGEWARSWVRIQDDHDVRAAAGDDLFDREHSCVRVPPLPAMRRYYVDLALADAESECVGFGSTVIDVAGAQAIADVRIEPSRQIHPAGPPVVDLPAGGPITFRARVEPGGVDGLTVRWHVEDCSGRWLAETTAPVTGNEAAGRVTLPAPVAVSHALDVALFAGDTALAVTRVPFTIPVAFPYDDFTVLMWSYAGGERPVRIENRLCYEMGSDMMDLCHMGGYSDEGAAREYALSAWSGQRLVPYVTRIAGEAAADHSLGPGLFNEAWIEGQHAAMATSCRQAAPYAPTAYTLGDENYLARHGVEVEVSPGSVAAFREWLSARYADIAALNAAWHTAYTAFDEILSPMLIEDAAAQTTSFAPWFDFRRFMDSAFADLHRRLAGFVREQDPGAKVGWDGLLSYHWLAGYDFNDLAEGLELNQVYTTNEPQGDLVRSFKRPGALTGEWGNAVADKEDGFSAITWHNLLRGHNSCWWWTSWGCDYIPFNPDLSVSHMGRWFFNQARAIKAGPGKLLLHATRDHSGIAILYSQTDFFAATLAAKLDESTAWPSEVSWLNNLKGAMHAIKDLGRQFQFVAADAIEKDATALNDYGVVLLPYATCLSDTHVAALRAFVERGGTIIADGRATLLTGNGVIRENRPLDDVFGVTSAVGRAAFAQAPMRAEIDIQGRKADLFVLEPALRLKEANALAEVDGAPIMSVAMKNAGRGILLNVPFATFNTARADEEAPVLLSVLNDFLDLAGVKSPLSLRGENGRPRCIEQVRFTDGDLEYLCLQQDILVSSLEAQPLLVSLDAAAFVCDVRSGQPVAEGRVASWSTTVSRGWPQVFAVLPYQVAAVAVEMGARARPGDAVRMGVEVKTESAPPQYHVVHVDVFAPGCDIPHRQYSVNIDCPGGRGNAAIPFALNDPAGTWRLVFTDVATGTRAERTIELAP
ncbi:MAG TPA: beta-galactosidase [Candidatus Hydrogenedentes bacterium]|nr:beta-galactosidase [Candidatus Hydrogenedentota bacterium]HPG69642.1 beta-galactosidase [Candidatus Hydrogenedentota bacterium]